MNDELLRDFVSELYTIAEEKEFGNGVRFAKIKRGNHLLEGNHIALSLIKSNTEKIFIDDNDIEVFCLIASLFVLFPSIRKNDTYDLANILGKMNEESGKDKEQESSIEIKFQSLLRANYDELPLLLSKIIRLIANKSDWNINYYHLISDIFNWNNKNSNVQKQWARKFWVESIKIK